MSWECACGITNRDNATKCGGCGWTLEQLNEYKSSLENKNVKSTEEDKGIIKFPKQIDVVVTDINMQFGSMVLFMIKWALASIPAALILFLIFVLFGGLLKGCFGALIR